jgi:hypothetical protein
MKRIAKIGLLSLLATVLFVYLVDQVLFRIHVRQGNGYRVLQVTQFLATPLKGQKEEYDVMDTVPVTCARSLFPQPGAPPCWWLARHTVQWQ